MMRAAWFLALVVLVGGCKGGTVYDRLTEKARLTELMSMMNDIRIHQERFFNTYSSYLSSTEDERVFDGKPAGGEDAGYFEWTADCPGGGDTWCTLGFKPRGEQRPSGRELLGAQLQTMGWSPGAAPPSFVKDTSQRWLTVQARTAKNPDTGACVLLRLTNESREVQVLEDWKDCGP